ncbi:hypothetical protein H0H93_006708, partial [Arthromyces matolae]
MAESRSDDPLQLEVYGAVLVPLFFDSKVLPATTTLKDAWSQVLAQPMANIRETLEKPEIQGSVPLLTGPFRINRSDENALQDLRYHSDPTLFCLSLLEDESTSAFQLLTKNAADGRKAILENVKLKDELKARMNVDPNAEAIRNLTDEVNTLKEGMKTRDEEMKKEMKARDEEMKRRNEEMKTLYEQAKEKMKGQEEELKKHRDRIIALQKTTGPLWRRTILDDARKKLLDECHLTAENYVNRTEELVTAVFNNLSNRPNDPNGKKLNRKHLNAIFRKTSSIRQDGNTAAHEATPEDLAESILFAGLSKTK